MNVRQLINILKTMNPNMKIFEGESGLPLQEANVKMQEPKSYMLFMFKEERVIYDLQDEINDHFLKQEYDQWCEDYYGQY